MVITEAPVLISLDFPTGALPIILNIDAFTTIGWGAIVSQMQADGKLRPGQFESRTWNGAELKYDALKLEYQGLSKALKKLWF